jgi:hypothetical protein
MSGVNVMKEFVVRDKWVRAGTHGFPSFNLAINVSKYQFSVDLIFFWFDVEF